MPPRSTPPPKPSFFPPNDSSTYRDLLLFEERLKTTAASLQKRKSRYQLFLFQLLTVISFLLWEVLASPEASILAIPYTWLLQQLLPEIYPSDSRAAVHPYLTSGLLFVSVTTLVLFFASGMYTEKIAYANRYVPHANKALRSFNIYLNVRKPPLRSKFRLNPLSFFFPRPQNPPSPTLRGPSRPSTPRSSRSPSPTPGNNGRFVTKSTSVPISPIPPTSNPRGELIFSSRIDKSFREPYERYRAAFERRREEKERAARNARWWATLLFWRKVEQPVHSRSVSITSGRSSRGETPPGSAGGMRTRERSHSPVPDTKTPPSPGQSPKAHGRHSRERSVSPSRRFAVQEPSMRTLALERSTNLGLPA